MAEIGFNPAASSFAAASATGAIFTAAQAQNPFATFAGAVRPTTQLEESNPSRGLAATRFFDNAALPTAIQQANDDILNQLPDTPADAAAQRAEIRRILPDVASSIETFTLQQLPDRAVQSQFNSLISTLTGGQPTTGNVINSLV